MSKPMDFSAYKDGKCPPIPSGWYAVETRQPTEADVWLDIDGYIQESMSVYGSQSGENRVIIKKISDDTAMLIDSIKSSLVGLIDARVSVIVDRMLKNYGVMPESRNPIRDGQGNCQNQTITAVNSNDRPSVDNTGVLTQTFRTGRKW